MKNIRVMIEDTQHEQMLRNAAKAGFPDLETLFLHAAGIEHPELPLFRKLQAAFQKLPAGSCVRVNQLLSDWDKFPKASRLIAGRLFASAARIGLVKVAETGTGTGYHSTYTKP